MAYQIQINEDQRRIIAAALDAFCGGAPALFKFENSDLEEAADLRDHFLELPEDHKTCPPNCLHGFCL